MTKNKILLVENTVGLVRLFEEYLQEWTKAGNIILVASTREEAIDLADKNIDIRLVFLGDILDPSRKRFDTSDLVENIKSLCSKALLIASSSVPECNNQLIAAGCTAGIMKEDLLNLPKVLELIHRATTKGIVKKDLLNLPKVLELVHRATAKTPIHHTAVMA